MNAYEIGKDLGAMGARLQQLESQRHHPLHHGSHHDCHCTSKHDAEQAMRVAHGNQSLHTSKRAGIDPHQEAVTWKPDQPLKLPPYLYDILGLRPERLRDEPHSYLHDKLQFDVMPESKTWTCVPEPLILYVNWYAGGTDEFYRLQNQVFTIIRITNPNTGRVSAAATYSARLVASGKAFSHTRPATQSLSSYTENSQFKLTLRNAQGGFLQSTVGRAYSIQCHDNYQFVETAEIVGGMYDLVAGAQWEVLHAQQVDRC